MRSTIRRAINDQAEMNDPPPKQTHGTTPSLTRSSSKGVPRSPPNVTKLRSPGIRRSSSASSQLSDTTTDGSAPHWRCTAAARSRGSDRTFDPPLRRRLLWAHGRLHQRHLQRGRPPRPHALAGRRARQPCDARPASAARPRACRTTCSKRAVFTRSRWCKA